MKSALMNKLIKENPKVKLMQPIDLDRKILIMSGQSTLENELI